MHADSIAVSPGSTGQNGHGPPPSDTLVPTVDWASPGSMVAVGESPFLAEYQIGERMISKDGVSEAFLDFVHELHDPEFDTLLYELVSDASEAATGHAIQEVGSSPRGPDEVERLVAQHFSPLREEIDRFFDDVAAEVGTRDVESMSEIEFDELLDSFAPGGAGVPNLHQQFLGKLWKKAKKAAKGAFNKIKSTAKSVAKKIGDFGLKFLWPKLKKVAKNLLRRVLRYALNKIPAQYRPLAKTLARRLGLLREVAEADDLESETAGFFALQNEFDTVLAGFVHVDDEVAHEVAIEEFGGEFANQVPVDLAAARERFVRRMSELEEGEDPSPVVEEFAQAILMAVRLGIRLIGRSRVVNFLAKYLAKLIRRLVGQQAAVPLARVLVDSGMRLLKLEITPEDELESARYAIAGLVEDTVRQVAELPDYVLENEALLEGHVAAAMESAAAANLPQMLPEKVYRKKPHLREATRCKGTWVMLPMGRRRRYKKHTQRHKVLLTPHLAKTVKSFGGRPLESFLREQTGASLTGEVEATAHLYEIVMGGGADDIVRSEGEVPGLGRVKAGWRRLHPLTPASAAMLFHEPGHGRETESEFLRDARHLQAGQRLYFLEVPGAYGGAPGIGGDGELSATLDMPRREVRLALYLGESETEDLLDRLKVLRRGRSAVYPIHSVLRKRLKDAMRGNGLGRMALRHGARMPGMFGGKALRRLPRNMQEQLVDRLDQWASTGIADELVHRGDELFAALQDEAEGVTLTATLHGPPGMEHLAAAFDGEITGVQVDWLAGPAPNLSLSIESGRGAIS